MYHVTKLGSKKISFSVDLYGRNRHIYYTRTQCDLELEDSKPIFLHDTVAHDDASP